MRRTDRLLYAAGADAADRRSNSNIGMASSVSHIMR